MQDRCEFQFIETWSSHFKKSYCWQSLTNVSYLLIQSYIYEINVSTTVLTPKVNNKTLSFSSLSENGQVVGAAQRQVPRPVLQAQARGGGGKREREEREAKVNTQPLSGTKTCLKILTALILSLISISTT